MADWTTDAACRDYDPEWWFIDGQGADAKAMRTAAKRICGACAVRIRCLDWAITTATRYGIWGGLDDDERHSTHASVGGAEGAA